MVVTNENDPTNMGMFCGTWNSTHSILRPVNIQSDRRLEPSSLNGKYFILLSFPDYKEEIEVNCYAPRSETRESPKHFWLMSYGACHILVTKKIKR